MLGFLSKSNSIQSFARKVQINSSKNISNSIKQQSCQITTSVSSSTSNAACSSLSILNTKISPETLKKVIKIGTFSAIVINELKKKSHCLESDQSILLPENNLDHTLTSTVEDVINETSTYSNNILISFYNMLKRMKKNLSYFLRIFTISFYLSPLVSLIPINYYLTSIKTYLLDYNNISSDDILLKNKLNKFNYLLKKNFIILSNNIENITWNYLLYSISQLGPCFIKLAQWASTRPDLFPIKLVNRLTILQDDVGTYEEIKQKLNDSAEDNEDLILLEKIFRYTNQDSNSNHKSLKQIENEIRNEIIHKKNNSKLLLKTNKRNELPRDSTDIDNLDNDDNEEFLINNKKIFNDNSELPLHVIDTLNKSLDPNWNETLHIKELIGSGSIAQVYRGILYRKKSKYDKERELELNNQNNFLNNTKLIYNNMLERSKYYYNKIKKALNQQEATFIDTDLKKFNEKKKQIVEFLETSTIIPANFIENSSFVTSDDEEIEAITVAVKIIHPHISKQIIQDMEILEIITNFVERNNEVFELLAFGSSIRNFTKSMKDQLDLRIEAHHLKKFRENFKYDNWATFPEPIDGYITKNVLVETFIDGIPINTFITSVDKKDNEIKSNGCETQGEIEYLNNSIISNNECFLNIPSKKLIKRMKLYNSNLSDEELIKKLRNYYPWNLNKDELNYLKIKLADLGSRVCLKMIFFDNYMHGDLHPGNVFVRFLPNGEPQLVLLDCGITYSCPNEEAHKTLVEVCIAFIQHEGIKAGRLMLTKSDDLKKLKEEKEKIHSGTYKKALADRNSDGSLGKYVKYQGEEIDDKNLSLEELKRKNEEEFCKKIDDMIIESQHEKYFEHLNEYFNKLCTIAYQHQVRFDDNYFKVMLAIKVAEGIALGLNRDLDMISMCLPIIIKARAMRAIGLTRFPTPEDDEKDLLKYEKEKDE